MLATRALEEVSTAISISTLSPQLLEEADCKGKVKRTSSSSTAWISC